MSLAAVLRRPGVGRLGLAGLLSETGDWMLFIALPLWVLDLTGSPLVTASVFALELVPTVLAAPFAGVLVDRLDPWRLMPAVATLQALVLLPLLAVGSARELWIVLAVVVVESVLSTVIEPCRSATAAGLVPAGDLAGLNQVLAMLSSVARLAGGPLGGLLLGLRGIDGVIIADAGTFAVVAALLAVRSPRTPAGAREPGAQVRLVRDWGEGLAAIRRAPVLRRTLVVVALAALAQGAFVVLFVLFVLRDLGGSEADVGVLRGVQAIGSIAGGVVLVAAIRRADPGRLLSLSLAAIGVLSLLTWNGPPATTEFGVYVALFVAVGVPGLTLMTGLLTLVQSHAAPAVRGRVLSTVFAVFGGVQALGMMVAGLVGTGAGLTTALEVQGGLHLAAALVARGLAGRPVEEAGRPAVAERPRIRQARAAA